MGTNYYWKKDTMIQENMVLGFVGNEYEEDKDREHCSVHIGKRSAAGLYCFDCGATLCRHGTFDVHSGRAEWHEDCPSCGKKREEESSGGTGMRELGFNKEPFEFKKGVKTCSSFCWTLMKHKWKIEELSDKENPCYDGIITIPDNQRTKVIVNEYGDEFTASEFMALLQECPIEYQDAEEFS
jgi:hypothetical protein